MKNQPIMLTNVQIESLFDFVKSKRVRYKDVQLEIVDHLASGIEDKILKDPSKSFSKALDEIYSGFPITGFAQLIEEKTKSMNRFWRTRLWHYIGQYFTLPKIILTAFIFMVFFYILSNSTMSSSYVFLPFSCIGIILLAIFHSKHKRFLFTNNWFGSDIKNDYLVLESYYKNVLIFINIAFFPIYILNRSYLIDSTIEIVLMATFTTFITISFHSFMFVFPEFLEEELNNNYKHLNIAKRIVA